VENTKSYPIPSSGVGFSATENYNFSLIFNRFVKKIKMVSPETKSIILDYLKEFNLLKVGIFGSFARGENKEGSDIDIMVEFKEPPSLLKLIKIENDLSEILGIKVDLVTKGALKNKRIKKSIKKDLISIL
jgi:predicted nucleotidyltransferase